MKKRKTGLGMFALAVWICIAAAPWSAESQTLTKQAIVTGTSTIVYVDTTKTDPETGLAVDNQLMLVKSQCTACHSSKLILQSQFTREKWLERIRWMQRTQNLWDLGDQEPAILAYLVKHYGPATQPFDGRRQPLKPVNWRTDSPNSNPPN